MTIQRDAAFLCGFLAGTYDLKGESALPAIIQPFVERIMSANAPIIPHKEIERIMKKSPQKIFMENVVESITEDSGGAHEEETSADEDAIPADKVEPEGEKPKRKSNMTPEKRAAAAERMRAYQAKKRAEREALETKLFRPESEGAEEEIDEVEAPPQDEEPPVAPLTPESAARITKQHDEYIGQRDPGQELSDEDWPDIQAMLRKGINIRKISSDYDIPCATMNMFVDRHLIAEARASDARKRG